MALRPRLHKAIDSMWGSLCRSRRSYGRYANVTILTQCVRGGSRLPPLF